jgi:hypothetical protein
MKRASIARVVSAAALVCSLAAPAAVFAGADVNVSINGYLPAPPGVHVYVDSGRPYYIERERRVYIEKDPGYRRHRHDRGRHRGWEKGHGHGHGGHKH